MDTHADRGRDRRAAPRAPVRRGDRTAAPNSVKSGDATAALEVLRGDRADVSWIVADAEDGRDPEHDESERQMRGP